MKLLDQLRERSSRLAKLDLLRTDVSYQDYQAFCYAYDSNTVYNMKFDVSGHEGEPSKGMFNLLSDILDDKYSLAEAKMRVHTFAVMHGNLIKKIINKDLRCGVTASSLNTAKPGWVEVFKVQLAKEVPIDNLSYPLLAQIKYDGVRIIAIVKDGGVTFKTRNGKVVALPELHDAVLNLPFDSYILDGELTYAEGKTDERTGISGLVNSAMHGGTVDETDVVFNVFDTMPLSAFSQAICDDIYSDRFTVLMNIVSYCEDHKIRLATTNEVHNADGALALYEGALAMGYEGLILKAHDHKYTFKRSKDWVKIKEVKSADLTCTDINDGTGKYADMIGALVCSGKVEGKDVIVKVGSGLTDMQRSLHASEYYGQIIEIKYNSVIQDSKTGQWSLFLPRFVVVRTDK